MATKKPSIADQLIAKASAGQADLSLPAKAKAELAKLLEHNDNAPHKQRVSAFAAIEMLQTFGVKLARLKFDRVIKHHFNRGWGAQ